MVLLLLLSHTIAFEKENEKKGCSISVWHDKKKEEKEEEEEEVGKKELEEGFMKDRENRGEKEQEED